MITLITLILGLILGTVMIGVSIYVYVKDQVFGLGGSVLTLVGMVLLGLSIWQSVELSVGPEGGITAKFSQDLGATTADIKGTIAELELKLEEISQDITIFREKFPEVNVPEEIADKRAAKEKAFEENSAYSVLIFYKPQTEQVAKTIEDAFLSVGYKASSTATDLREALRRFPHGNAWIIYTERGKTKLEDVKSTLTSLSLGISLHPEPQPSTLRRGDIQVLLF